MIIIVIQIQAQKHRINLFNWIDKVKYKAGEIILCSIDHDGMKWL